MIGLNDVKRAIVSRKSHPCQALLVALGLGLATGFRWFTDQGANGVPFATFLPIVILAAIFLDWTWAAATAALSVVIVRQLLGFVIPELFWPTLVLFAAYALTALFMILVGAVLRRTIQEINRQAEEFRTYNAELQHRAKNALQIVRALASRAAKAADPVAFYETLAGRMDLMIKANELLGVGTMRQCDIAELAGIATEPFSQGSITLSGPPAQLAEEAGMPLMMALHELGTNALKYGSLSVEGGSVSLIWTVSDSMVELVWRESGGPIVAPPAKRGLGSRLLMPQGGLKSVDLQFLADGVVCRMALPRTG
jgi:two-component sensor histidine kinase